MQFVLLSGTTPSWTPLDAGGGVHRPSKAKISHGRLREANLAIRGVCDVGFGGVDGRRRMARRAEINDRKGGRGECGSRSASSAPDKKDRSK